MTVAVFGASGLVGSTLVERLTTRGCEVRAFVNSSGNAWRLVRRAYPFAIVDILHPTVLADAMRGCTAVVNCTRGGDVVMLDGLRNLLVAARQSGVRRFVHLSSVAVYGDPPPTAASAESAPAVPMRGSYGWVKLQQDGMVERAHAGGLDSVVLCPPNVAGPYAPFSCNLVDDLRHGRFVLLDGGQTPVNVVDVHNLCHAIELALALDHGDGRRIFVTDGDDITWRQLVDLMTPLAGCSDNPDLPRSDPFWSSGGGKASGWFSPLRAVKHLVSSDVRTALRRDPLLARLDAGTRALVAKLPARIEDGLRFVIEGPIKVAKVDAAPRFTSPFSRQQLRLVCHRIDRARQVLGYRPERSFPQAAGLFADWYRITYGMDLPAWPLIQEMRAALAAT